VINFGGEHEKKLLTLPNPSTGESAYVPKAMAHRVGHLRL